jgi:drug/metabolite transporter (DMT)-like permease
MSLKQHVLMGVMTVSFCISSILHWKNLAKEIPTLVIVSNQELVVFITTTLIFLLKNKKTISSEPYKKHFLNVILMAGVIFLALLFSFLGLKLTNPLISSLLFLASPLTTIVMNLIFFKEKLSVHNSIALVLLGAGAFILHYNTN